MVVQQRLYTAAELHEIENLPENAEKRFELIQGVIYEVPTPNPKHAVTSGKFVRRIGNYLDDNPIGFVVGDACGFDLPNGDVLIPDAAFISKARQPELPDRFKIAPDLAIEVVSPSNRPREILNKVESYLEAGTKLMWVAYPEERVVDVWRKAADDGLHKQKFTIDDVLDGGDVLPGFTLPVQDVFAEI